MLVLNIQHNYVITVTVSGGVLSCCKLNIFLSCQHIHAKDRTLRHAVQPLVSCPHPSSLLICFLSLPLPIHNVLFFFFLLLSLMPKLCVWKKLGQIDVHVCTGTHIEPEVIFNTESSKTGPQQTSPLITSKQIEAFHGHSAMILRHSASVWEQVTTGQFLHAGHPSCNNLNVFALDARSCLLYISAFVWGWAAFKIVKRGYST